MLHLDWQNSIALTLVAVAAAYLAYRAVAVALRRKKAGCGAGCEQCTASPDPLSTPTGSVITAEQLAKSLPPSRRPGE